MAYCNGLHVTHRVQCTSLDIEGCELCYARVVTLLVQLGAEWVCTRASLPCGAM